MRKHLSKSTYLFFGCAFVATGTQAELSSTLTLASDYLFNGVSQTDEDPALQGSLDWADEAGWYVGSWASNVDFGDDTNLEVDLYAGYATEFGGWINLDLALLHYTYHGSSTSNDIDYSELKASIGLGDTRLSAWYAWDYAGTSAGHYIVAVTHALAISENVSLTLHLDRSASLDEDKFTWEPGDKDYFHYSASLGFSWQNFDFSVGVEATDLDSAGDTTILASVSRTFSF